MFMGRAEIIGLFHAIHELINLHANIDGFRVCRRGLGPGHSTNTGPPTKLFHPKDKYFSECDMQQSAIRVTDLAQSRHPSHFAT